MKKTIFLLVVLLAFTTLSCKKTTTTTIGSVVGTVTDSTTGEVIEGVTITIDTLGLTTTSSNTGEYSFMDIASGYYYMEFTKTGYDTIGEWNTITKDYVDTLDMAMVYQDTVIVTKAVNVALAGQSFTVWRKSECSVVTTPSWISYTGVEGSIFDSYIYSFTADKYTGSDYGRYDSIIMLEVSTGELFSVPISQGDVLYHEASGMDETISTTLANMFGWNYGATVTTLHLYGTVNEADLLQIGKVMCVEELDLYNTTVVDTVTTNYSYGGVITDEDGNTTPYGGLVQQIGNAIPYNFMQVFDYDEDTYVENTTLKSITLPKDVTVIGERAFVYCTALETITSQTVTSVGRHAFRHCSSLSSASFPVATLIDEYAFYDCGSLSSVSFPVGDTINKHAFMNCSSLKSVSFPMVTYINDYGFYNCTSLYSVSFPVVSKIGDAVFYQCTSLYNPEFKVATSVGQYAFYGCTKLSQVKLPVVETLGRSALRSCDNLSTVDYPMLTTIGAETFLNCTSLSTLELPAVTTSGSYAFSNCSSLTSISLPVISVIDSYSFGGCSSLTQISLATDSQLTSSTMVFNSFSNSAEVTLTLGSTNSSMVNGNVFTDSYGVSTTFLEIVLE